MGEELEWEKESQQFKFQRSNVAQVTFAHTSEDAQAVRCEWLLCRCPADSHADSV